MSKSVGIKATFSVDGRAVHAFESSEQESSERTCSSLPLPDGVEGSDKYDHRYTGRHDHGTLPALKSGGPHGDLIQALLEAKEDSDAFLTELINQELAEESDGGKEGAPAKVHQEQRSTLCGRDDKAEGAPAEAMELCDATGGAGAAPSRHEREALPKVPPITQPAKRPKP